MSLNDLLKDTRNPWAKLRIESLQIDTDFEVSGDVTIVSNLLIGGGLTVTNNTVVSNLLIGGGLTVTNNTVTNTLKVNSDAGIDGQLIDGEPDENKSFIDNGDIYTYTFPFNNTSAANANLTVKVQEIGKLCCYEIFYQADGDSDNLEELRFTAPAGLPDRFKPIRTLTIPIIIQDTQAAMAKYYHGLLSLIENTGNIDIIYLNDADDELDGWPVGGVYNIPDYFSFTFLASETI